MSRKPKPPRLPELLLTALQGLDWSLEHGTKHWLLKVDGKLVAILPHGHMSEAESRNLLLVRSRIRQSQRSQACQ